MELKKPQNKTSQWESHDPTIPLVGIDPKGLKAAPHTPAHPFRALSFTEVKGTSDTVYHQQVEAQSVLHTDKWVSSSLSKEGDCHITARTLQEKEASNTRQTLRFTVRLNRVNVECWWPEREGGIQCLMGTGSYFPRGRVLELDGSDRTAWWVCLIVLNCTLKAEMAIFMLCVFLPQ
jgi:hypothetical protein